MINGVVNTNNDWSGKWLLFRDTGKLKPGATTHVWTVEGLDTRIPLGIIRWWAAWRKYTYLPLPNLVFDSGCLNELAEFCEMQTKLLTKTWPARGEQKRKPVVTPESPTALVKA